MKVLFLDIDGVLNSHRSAYAFGGFPFDVDKHRHRFDEVAVALIRNVVKAAGAQIVLSSSWRTDKDWERIGRGLDLPITDRTPEMHPGPRGAEIAAWLADYPEVEAYAIVDDDPDMLDEQLPYFVKTRHEDGLTYADANRLAELLGCNTSDVLRTVRPAGVAPADKVLSVPSNQQDRLEELERQVVQLTRERDEWAAKWQRMRRKYAELRWPGLTRIIAGKDAPGVPAQYTDPAGRADWVGKPGASLPHESPSGGKGEAAGTTRQTGETPVTTISGVEGKTNG